jgi:hypothetical protein
MTGFGRQVGAGASIALGAFLLWGGDFAVPWEYVQAQPPLRALLAYFTGAILVAAGAALFWRRAARGAALVLAGIATVFSLLWVLKAAAMPATYDPWSNVAEESSIVAGYLALFASLAPQKTDNMARLAFAARIWFGACSLSFGVVHFTAFHASLRGVPSGMPFGADFWVAATGVAHLAAGIAILSGVWALLAVRMAALMYVGFVVFDWGRALLILRQLTSSQEHFVLGAIFISLALAAAAWMTADAIAAYPPIDGRLFNPRRQD